MSTHIRGLINFLTSVVRTLTVFTDTECKAQSTNIDFSKDKCGSWVTDIREKRFHADSM